MRSIPTALQIGITALAFAVVACTPGTQATPSPPTEGSDSIVGTWTCMPPEEAVELPVEIRADGTVIWGESTLSWAVEGDSGSFRDPEQTGGEGDQFTIEDDRLVFEDGFVCTRAD